MVLIQCWWDYCLVQPLWKTETVELITSISTVENSLLNRIKEKNTSMSQYFYSLASVLRIDTKVI